MIRKIEIVSLSSGVLGERFVKHEVELGLKRLRSYGVEVSFGAHALDGLQAVKDNPKGRAEDLLRALTDDSVDMILCAVGGDDTYRLLPYLFENDALPKAASSKVFLGFSDTTMNHFMLHKIGMKSFYGQAFLPDVCELSDTMLPYTEHYFKELLETGGISKITPSDVWYDERDDFGPDKIGTERVSHDNNGFTLLQGDGIFSGPVLGGCIDTIYDMFDNTRYADSAALCTQYGLFPSKEEWQGKILLLESSEERPTPEKYRKALRYLKETGIFEVLSGILIGKPQNEVYYEEYQKILIEEIDNGALPIVYNINIGHATPRCIIPFGVPAIVDVTKQEIKFTC